MSRHISVLSKCPNFIRILWHIVNNSKFWEWSEDGTTLRLTNLNSFINNEMNLYFKHKNFVTFTRQMYKYKFKKNKNEYFNKFFQKDQPELLINFQKKIYDDISNRGSKTKENFTPSPPDFSINETESLGNNIDGPPTTEVNVQELCEKVRALEIEMQSVKRENITLWKTVANLDRSCNNALHYFKNLLSKLFPNFRYNNANSNKKYFLSLKDFDDKEPTNLYTNFYQEEPFNVSEFFKNNQRQQMDLSKFSVVPTSKDLSSLHNAIEVSQNVSNDPPVSATTSQNMRNSYSNEVGSKVVEPRKTTTSNCNQTIDCNIQPNSGINNYSDAVNYDFQSNTSPKNVFNTQYKDIPTINTNSAGEINNIEVNMEIDDLPLQYAQLPAPTKELNNSSTVPNLDEFLASSSFDKISNYNLDFHFASVPQENNSAFQHSTQSFSELNSIDKMDANNSFLMDDLQTMLDDPQNCIDLDTFYMNPSLKEILNELSGFTEDASDGQATYNQIRPDLYSIDSQQHSDDHHPLLINRIVDEGFVCLQTDSLRDLLKEIPLSPENSPDRNRCGVGPLS